MKVNVEQLFLDELAELNRAVEILGIPDEVFSECGSARVCEAVATRCLQSISEMDAAIEPLAASIQSDAIAKFELLCQSANHVPRRALSALCEAYGALMLLTNNGQNIDAPEGDATVFLQALMGIATLRGLALGAAGLDEGVLKVVQKNIEREKKQAEAAEKRHRENRSMKDDVFKWLDSNMEKFKSMDAAALAIAGKLQPIEFSTARTWVGQWRKKQSPRTP